MTEPTEPPSRDSTLAERMDCPEVVGVRLATLEEWLAVGMTEETWPGRSGVSQGS